MDQQVPDQYELLELINLVVSSLSISGSLIIIIALLFFRKKSLLTKLLLSLSTSDLIYGAANVMSYFPVNEQNNILCNLQGFLREFGFICSLVWVMCMCRICFKQLLHKQIDSNKQFKIYCIISFLFGSLIASIPLFSKFIADPFVEYGPSENLNCSLESSGLVYLAFDFIPVWICSIDVLVLSYKAYQILKNRNSGFKDKGYLMYPLILIVSWIPGSIDRAVFTIKGERIFTLQCLHIIFGNIQGLTNAIFFNRDIFCCKQRSPNTQIQDSTNTNGLLSELEVNSNVSSSSTITQKESKHFQPQYQGYQHRYRHKGPYV